MNTLEFFNLKPLINTTAWQVASSQWVSIIYLEGVAEIKYEKNTVSLSNTLLLVHGQQEVEIKFLSNGGGWIINFTPDLCNSIFLSQISDCPIFRDFFMLKEEAKDILLIETSNCEDFHLAIAMFITQMKTKDKYTSKTLRASLILLLTIIHRDYERHISIINSTMMPDYRIGEILKYMSDNYATVTLSSIAEHFNYNPNYFSQLFTNLIGAKFSHKLQQIRIEHAKELLATTNLSIEEIRCAVGFEEKSYFHRIFKARYNMTPAAWRRHLLTSSK